MSNNLKHVGILGMHWGHRKKSTTLKPTYQFRDSQGNLVTRYGKGRFGGGSKPDTTSKSAKASDKKFMSDVNKQSHFQRSVQQKYGHTSVNSLLTSVKPKAIKAAKVVIATFAIIKVSDIIVGTALNVAWNTGKVISSSPIG